MKYQRDPKRSKGHEGSMNWTVYVDQHPLFSGFLAKTTHAHKHMFFYSLPELMRYGLALDVQ